MKPIKLKDWQVVIGNDPHKTPEEQKPSLKGRCFDHPMYVNNSIITTSHIIGKQNGLVITVSGSAYELGNPERDYEKLLPKAKDQLMKALKELSFLQ